MHRPIIFVTDYGRDDAYAAALVGAAWTVQPGVVCIEGTHGVLPGDILAGAYHLKSLAIAFQRDVVFCGVVDPGVGTERRAIAIDTGSVYCVGPDNGLMSYLWREAPEAERRAVEVLVPPGVAPTFHGRDVFAPAAATLAVGMGLDVLGEPIDDPLVLDEAFASQLGTGLVGRVAVVDHFGNAITTLRSTDLGGAAVTNVSWSSGGTAHLARTYADIGHGQLAAVIGSAGHLEIAASGAPAASLGGPALRQQVTVDLR